MVLASRFPGYLTILTIFFDICWQVIDTVCCKRYPKRQLKDIRQHIQYWHIVCLADLFKTSLMIMRYFFTLMMLSPIVVCAQWVDQGSSIRTDDKVAIGTDNPEAQLDVKGNFKLDGPFGVLMRSGVFGSQQDVASSRNKWIKFGEITLNGVWNDANLVVDFFPWNAAHGDSRQQLNISIRNNRNGIEGSYDLSLTTFYARDLTIKDVKLIHTSGSGVTNNKVSIWIQMGDSHCYNVPFVAYYHGNILLNYTRQPHHESIIDAGTEYKLNSTHGMYGDRFGIGTNTPSAELEVNGTIRSKEVKVEASPWPDYVFEEAYDLRSLEATEQYIQRNKHLPEIPSAEEIQANGLVLGEMNRLLLQKVEELTLHLISKEKEINKLTEKVEQMEKKLNRLIESGEESQR